MPLVFTSQSLHLILSLNTNSFLPLVMYDRSCFSHFSRLSFQGSFRSVLVISAHRYFTPFHSVFTFSSLRQFLFQTFNPSLLRSMINGTRVTTPLFINFKSSFFLSCCLCLNGTIDFNPHRNCFHYPVFLPFTVCYLLLCPYCVVMHSNFICVEPHLLSKDHNKYFSKAPLLRSV